MNFIVIVSVVVMIFDDCWMWFFFVRYCVLFGNVGVFEVFICEVVYFDFISRIIN